MKKITTLLSLFLLFSISVFADDIAINEENFPDANFRAIVAGAEIDTNQDGTLSESEIAAVKLMRADEKSIETLKGIEYFTSLQQLRCSRNQLKELDISKNTALTWLNCTNNQLAELDVTNNTLLTGINCWANQLTSLDVSKNTKLISLYCYENQLSSLDVSNNTELLNLNCSKNQITSLDVSKNTALTGLFCYDNQLKELDITQNTALEDLWCNNNQLTTLDVSKNTAITYLHCEDNQLSTLDVSNNAALTYLCVMGNQIKGEGMDVLLNSLPTVTDGTFLVMDNAGYYTENNVCTKAQVAIAKEKGWNVLAYTGESGENSYVNYEGSDSEGYVAINEENFPDAHFREYVSKYIDKDDDGSLSPEECAAVKILFDYGIVYKRDISDLTGIEYFTELEELQCSQLELTSLDLSNNTALIYLDCSYCKLTSLDLSKNTQLIYVYLDGNQISGEAMDALMNSLPTVTNGTIAVVNTASSTEKNSCTKEQVAIAKSKGWKVLACNGSEYKSYEGDGEYSVEIAINEENFPDAHFREYVSKYIDKDYDGVLSLEECAAVKRIFEYGTTYWTDISSVQGIEYFTELETLDLYNVRVTSLDLSKNTALKTLRIRDNYTYGNRYLESLDISKNVALEILDVSAAKLTSLDVSHLKNLKELYCSGLKLGTLDISNNLSLEVLACGSNDLTSLDLSNHLSLKKLRCEYNNLPSLDVSKLTGLTELNCSNDQLTSLDLSNNLALDTLSCSGNNLGVLDVSMLTELKYLVCVMSGLSDLDLSKNTKLEYLYCDLNPLTKLDVSKNLELKTLRCNGGRISETEICQLPALDISSNTKLEALYCSGNSFTSLDVSKNPALLYLRCNNNQLTALDVTKNANLRQLVCDKNQLTSLDVSKNNALWSLTCSENQLTSIDISHNPDISDFDCSRNQIERLDVSANEQIYSVYCEQNKLKSLKVSEKNTRLGWLHCPGNELKGAAIDSLISNVPQQTYASITVIDTLYANEKNVCTKAQVAAFKEKGWTVRVRHNQGANVVGDEYEGSDPQTLDPLENGDNVNIGNDINSDTNLDGNVVNNVLYNISSDNGSYDATEGCLVINKSTSDDMMSALVGKDIFGEDFQGQFTGVVFKVAEGSGQVKVEAETSGTMLLKVKIGNNPPVTMELQGKLKFSFGYDVAEETNVYIYAGTPSSQAKGMRKANGDGNALKIYGIEITRTGPSGIGYISAEDGLQDVYSLSGQKVRLQAKDLKGLPAGVYIVGGKKVVVK